MQVKLAETAGFCMGVRRAMDRVLEEARKADKPLYTLGPLIHNRHAVEMLEKRGVKAIEDTEGITEGTVIIRAHGIPLSRKQALEDAGLEVVDATCPHVRYSQNVVRKRHNAGSKIIIAGDKDHAEVVGLLGYCDNEGVLVSSEEEAEQVHLDGSVCLIAQTTFNEGTFGKIAEIIRANHNEVEVVDTICRSTEERQREIVELCKSVDAMVVVGGKHSANTCRLAEIAAGTGTPTIHVETAAELPREFARYDTVGVTAGASTPNWITAAVMRELEHMGQKQGLPQRLLMRGVQLLTNSTIYTGLAAVALTYASISLQKQGGGFNWLHLAIAFCYIFCVHVWNRISAQAIDDLNVPPRVAFYKRHPALLIALTTIFGVGSLLIALHNSTTEAGLLAGAYLVGLAYNIPLAPPGRKHRRLRDIPASKDICTAIGWASVAVIIPLRNAPVESLTLAALVAFILAFIRSTLFDFTDIQGDRLLGRETLPVFLGSNRTRKYLAVLTLVLAALLIAGVAAGAFSTVAYWLVPVPVLILLVLYPLFQNVIKNEMICPLIADGLIVLTGLLAVAWQLLMHQP